jgi:hypothetical protein
MRRNLGNFKVIELDGATCLETRGHAAGAPHRQESAGVSPGDARPARKRPISDSADRKQDAKDATTATLSHLAKRDA